MKKNTFNLGIFLLIILISPSVVRAQRDSSVMRGRFLSVWEYSLSAGMTLGGSTPLTVPDEVNSIKKFRIQPGLSLGAQVRYRFHSRWSVESGLRFEMKRMEVTARTTHYNMVLIDPDGGELKGVWTGYVKTDANNYYFSVPVRASWRATSDWRLRGGLFFSYAARRRFMGTVYDGYLRKDNPTGERIDIDEARYDFSPDLSRFGWGVELGSSLQLSRRISVYGDLSFQLNDIFRPGFRVLDFSLHPFYFNLGAAYTF